MTVLRTKHITEVFDFQSGGGCEVSLVCLVSGEIVGIDEDVICVYKNMQSLLAGEEPIVSLSTEKHNIYFGGKWHEESIKCESGEETDKPAV